MVRAIKLEGEALRLAGEMELIVANVRQKLLVLDTEGQEIRKRGDAQIKQKIVEMTALLGQDVEYVDIDYLREHGCAFAKIVDKDPDKAETTQVIN